MVAASAVEFGLLLVLNGMVLAVFTINHIDAVIARLIQTSVDVGLPPDDLMSSFAADTDVLEILLLTASSDLI